MASNCKVGMKIVVKGHANSFFYPSSLQDFNVLGLFHADLGNVNGVEAV